MPSQGVLAAPVNHPPGWGSGNLKTWKAEICLDSWWASLGRFISVITELAGGQWERFSFSGFQNFSSPPSTRCAAAQPERPRSAARRTAAHTLSSNTKFLLTRSPRKT